MNKINKKVLWFVWFRLHSSNIYLLVPDHQQSLEIISKLCWVYNTPLNYLNFHYPFLWIHQSSQWLFKLILGQQHWICWLGTVFSLKLYLSVSSVTVISNNWHFCSAWKASTLIKLNSFISWWWVAPLNYSGTGFTSLSHQQWLSRSQIVWYSSILTLIG